MRSTTVGWLTSILRILPVTADHKWLNRDRPEFRDNINHPTEPTDRSEEHTSELQSCRTLFRSSGLAYIDTEDSAGHRRPQMAQQRSPGISRQHQPSNRADRQIGRAHV